MQRVVWMLAVVVGLSLPSLVWAGSGGRAREPRVSSGGLRRHSSGSSREHVQLSRSTSNTEDEFTTTITAGDDPAAAEGMAAGDDREAVQTISGTTSGGFDMPQTPGRPAGNSHGATTQAVTTDDGNQASSGPAARSTDAVIQHASTRTNAHELSTARKSRVFLSNGALSTSEPPGASEGAAATDEPSRYISGVSRPRDESTRSK